MNHQLPFPPVKAGSAPERTINAPEVIATPIGKELSHILIAMSTTPEGYIQSVTIQVQQGGTP